MKKLFPLLILVILVSFLSPISADPDFETLWCDSYVDNRLGWSVTGNPPYLDDTDGSYIYTLTDPSDEGDFGFEDLSSMGSITSVTLYLECYADDAPNDDSFDVYVYDGNSWTNEGNIAPSTTGWGNYGTLILSTKLDTSTKVNNAQIYFDYKKSKGPDEVYIRRAYLYVDYTPSQVQEYYRYPIQSLSWSGIGSKTLDTTRDFTQSITLSSDSSRTWSLSRTFTQGITLTSSALADIIKEILVQVSQGIGFTADSVRSWDSSRTFTQGISFASSTSKLAQFIRNTVQGITASVEALKSLGLTRVISQSIFFTSNTALTHLEYFLREVSLGLTIAPESLRYLTLKRNLAQTITVSSMTNKTANYIRTIQQGLSLTVETFIDYLAAGGEAFYRTVTMGLDFTANAIRRLSITRIVGQTISIESTTWNSYFEEESDSGGYPYGLIVIQTESPEEPPEEANNPYVAEATALVIGSAITYILKKRRG